MKSLSISKRLRICRPDRVKIQAPLSIEKIRWHLLIAESKMKFWEEYFPIYFDLFSTEKEAITKAKTHSVIVMIKWLHGHWGCSYSLIYEALVREINASEIVICQEMLKTKSKSEMIISIDELDDRMAIFLSYCND